uniref:UDP-N-acetylglucosamine--dolichyl-phosphate N-acetylglucosaminephosphotransferase n=1 Tax=Trepomonas sp. PC1 TaxID=1076344 RepID=A0A146KDQ4_9EUKA|eukprot:JAP94627.1 UDP-N-acetylglucosamine-dolichyl-phosphate N-acetylglucosaminephosphotransferase [Trepomonas sp. PC1]
MNETLFFLLKLGFAAKICFDFTKLALPTFLPKLLKAGLGGMDLNKPLEGQTEKTPEAGGVIVLFVITMIFCIFPETYRILPSLIAAGLLGFADNVLNLEWRWKLIIPAFTLMPLCQHYTQTFTFELNLFNYQINFPNALTTVLIILYSIFCQNAVNIYAGINGLEVGQSIVAQGAGLVYLFIKHGYTECMDHISLKASMFVSIFFISASLALFKFNKFPAKVFVGDVYTYLAGCCYVISAVCGNYLIVSGFLYFMQMINFIISIPQLVGWVPCPRHRLLAFHKEDGKLYGKTENWNVINQYVLRIIKGGLKEDQLLKHLLTIQTVGSGIILAVLFVMKKSVVEDDE